MNPFAIVPGFLIFAATAYSQDGKLLEKKAVQLPAETWSRVESNSPGTREAMRSVELSQITYLSDGLKISGYLAMPSSGEKLPCVIFNRGGNRDSGGLREGAAAALLGRVASWGYVVVASQYRGGPGSEGQEEFGGADVNDVMNLIPLLQNLARADASRLGMYGWSRGGMMTYLALARSTNIAAAVIGAGPTDVTQWIARRKEMETEVLAQLVPNYAKTKEAALRDRSAIFWPEKLCPQTPILLLQGTADWRVDPTDSLRMANALLEKKHPFRLVMLEGGDHGLSEYRTETDQLVRNWLDRYVRDRKPWPSLEPHGR